MLCIQVNSVTKEMVFRAVKVGLCLLVLNRLLHADDVLHHFQVGQGFQLVAPDEALGRFVVKQLGKVALGYQQGSAGWSAGQDDVFPLVCHGFKEFDLGCGRHRPSSRAGAGRRWCAVSACLVES